MTDINDFMPQSIKGKTAIITGSTSGIGLAIAKMLSAAGARVLITGNRQDKLDKALMEFNHVATADVFGLTADVSEKEGIENIFAFADDKLGAIDIFVSNAAIGYGKLTNSTYNGLDNMIKINFTAYIDCIRQAVIRMKNTGGGHIVAVGSMSADGREEGGSVYVAAKAGIQAFCESLRKEVNKDNIKLTLIEPGAVDTDMQEESNNEKEEKIKKMEMLTAADIAASVLFCLTQPKRCDIVQLKIKPHMQFI